MKLLGFLFKHKPQSQPQPQLRRGYRPEGTADCRGTFSALPYLPDCPVSERDFNQPLHLMQVAVPAVRRN